MTLVPFACHPSASRGRLFAEDDAAVRDCFQRDRDRIIHAAAFRRLEYKTQVFVNHEGDHYRTRLTHSLEVSQIARTLARALHVNEDLSEAVALAHDVGHTPFGHAGEDALNAVMQPFGGFNHNAQALRILTDLENRYARFRGLNLTWEMLEGVVKHNGALLPALKKPVPPYILEFNAKWNLELHTFAGLEAQLASLADDIAYTCHDVEDGLRAELFTVNDLKTVPALYEIFYAAQQQFSAATAKQHVFEALRALMGILVRDVLQQTTHHLSALKPQTAEDIRAAKNATAAFSPTVEILVKDTKTFLMQRMYRHYKVNRMTLKAHRVVAGLFNLFMENPTCLPPKWQPAAAVTIDDAARQIANYIAGMTDRFALEQYTLLSS